MIQTLLGIFAKHWQPGQVKTRLARDIGAAAASQLHRAMVAHLAKRLRQTGDERWLVVSPPASQAAFEELAPAGWRVVPQAEGDLGHRMRCFFDAAFAAGADRVVLIGSDSPTLPLPWFRQAFHILADRDVVLGPTEDGGYYLVGCARPVPTIFRDIAWSTPEVFSQTVARLAEGGLRWKALPAWYDVDELADLRRLRHELQEQSSHGGTADELLRVADAALEFH